MSHPIHKKFSVYNQCDSLEEAFRLGFFIPEEKASMTGFPELSFSPKPPSTDPVFYYPGAFGEFHEGHISVVDNILEKATENAWIVISPAHASYVAEKYGKWSFRASNKYRFDNIMRTIRQKGQKWQRVIIDTYPMLAVSCDQNFTDFSLGFQERNGMTGPLTIVTGKDRSSWLGLNKLTSALRVMYVPDQTGASTSLTENPMRQKKKALLRVTDENQAQLFMDAFHDQYEGFDVLTVEEERKQAENVINKNRFDCTICKEYAGLLPYIPFGRTFVNALSDPTFPDIPQALHNKNILDSDIYSGATREALRSVGSSITPVVSVLPKTEEVIDISDFLKPDFCYPHYDLSERLSMQAFTLDFHRRMEEFRRRLLKMEKGCFPKL